jgi:two-component system, NtrC family, sensor kinase
LAAVMFMGSMAPTYFLKSRIKVSYILLFSVPLTVFIVMTSLFPSLGIPLRIIDSLAAIAVVIVGVHWGSQSSLLPRWFTMWFAVVVGGVCICLTFAGEYEFVMRLAQSSVSLMTAVLVLAVYRRLSPGVIFTVTGLLIWVSPMVVDPLLQPGDPYFLVYLRAVNLMKVVTAVGMIVLVLEDELIRNEEAQRRDRRVRTEMEEYSRLDVSAVPHRNAGFRYDRICEAIVRVSRFSQAAILLRTAEQNHRVVGCAGMDGALAGALDSLGQRTPPEKLEELRQSSHCSPVSGGAKRMDLHPLMTPGDDLELLKFDSAYVILMETGAAGLEGIVLLSSMKSPSPPLEAEDFLPLELLTRRLAAEHESYVLLRRVAQSEKLAGLGQLAGGVAHELNNPLTVVMGYAELIEESATDESVQRSAAVIHRESQRMKQTIDGLAYFSKSQPEAQVLLPLDQMLNDIWQQKKPEFERAGIDLELSIPQELPKVRANGDQMRQVILQILSNAATALQNAPRGERQLRMHAAHTRNRVQILISDNGPGFPNPERVFDPFFTTKQPGQGAGLGLSLVYSIIREHGGEISAFNLQPHGAAVAIEMPGDVAVDESEVSGEVLTN